jgi:hypothetical protein
MVLLPEIIDAYKLPQIALPQVDGPENFIKALDSNHC